MWFLAMEQVRLCAVWPRENWLGSLINHCWALEIFDAWVKLLLIWFGDNDFDHDLSDHPEEFHDHIFFYKLNFLIHCSVSRAKDLETTTPTRATLTAMKRSEEKRCKRVERWRGATGIRTRIRMMTVTQGADIIWIKF